ncbi:MAG TPA: diguanylate cyclase, partial [Trueperaceae bacterium]|nr:diguanylate cyclase [Trueperaceae bacterium]
LGAAWLGWPAGLLTAVASLVMVGVRDLGGGGQLQVADYAELAAAMIVAGVAGQGLHRIWQASERRAFDSDRRARLLQQAALELHQSQTSKHLFQAAPRLLSEILSFSHAALFVPDGEQLQLSTAWRWQPEPGFSIPLETVIGRAFRTGQTQYVPDTRLDIEFMPAPGADPTRSELALPVKVGRQVRAVINLEHTDPYAFTADDHETLRAFTRIIEEVLERLDATVELEEERCDQEFLARLSQELLRADDAGQAADLTVSELLRYLGADGGAVVHLKELRLKPLATVGDFPPGLAAMFKSGLEFTGLLKDVWHSRRSTYVDDLLERWTPPSDGVRADPVRSVALVPIVNQQGDVRALLGLVTLGTPQPFSERQRRLIENASGSLGVALDRAALSRQLFATLDVIRSLPRSDSPATLYQLAAEAAVELIPGAEASTVLVRHDDLFRFEAAVGYDLSSIKSGAGPLTMEEELRWYGGNENDYRRGVGRILKGEEVLVHSFASSEERSPARLDIARVPEIKANILIPITDNDDIVAMLNIDSFSTENAFGSNALRIAEAFAQHIAVIVRQAEQVRSLELNLVTDALTRLGNREGFQRKLNTEMARATRYDSPLNLVMLDLDNFKEVNDRLGHATGDKALVAVAEALRGQLRASDHAFRWGGDEFVLLLTDVQADEARLAAERFAGIVRSIEIQGLRLSASVGVASYPDDGSDPEALLRRADDLMYYRKQRSHRPVS